MPATLGAAYPQRAAYFSTKYQKMAFYDDSYFTASAPSVGTPTTNLAYYLPITLEVPHLISSFVWANGSTASLNVDVGIYDLSGTKVGTSTGSTAQSGTSALQSAAPSGGSFVVGPGVFYVAMQFSGNTANTLLGPSMSSLEHLRVIGVLQQAVGSFGLPANATFAANTQTQVPMAGIIATPLASTYRSVAPISITPWSALANFGCVIGVMTTGIRGTASAVWPAANRALYFPVSIPSPVILAQAFVHAGATSVNTNHFNIALYNADLTRILQTTSTTWSGSTNVLNVVNITDTMIPAGNYLLALWLDTGTDTVFRAAPGILANAQALGARQEAAAGGLPAVATPVALTTAYVPVFGFTQAATI